METKRRDHRHSVDMLFVITLFCTFAVCASLMIAFGAHIYQKTIDNIDDLFTIHTASSYITQKLRAHDVTDGITIEHTSDTDYLILRDYYDDQEYYTYIYEYDGCVRELLTQADSRFEPTSGQKILDMASFNIDQSGQLITVNLQDDKGEIITSYIYLHSME